jgi:anti-anti-sigma factor
MKLTDRSAELGELRAGSHVCWLVSDEQAYTTHAAALLAEGRRLGQKPVVFGPGESASLAELEPGSAIALDPYVAVLDRGPLDPEAMFAMFRDQSVLARAEGYDGLRVVADMDWLLPGHPAPEDVVTFEVLLDRVVLELDATVVCAYRSSSFDTAAIFGALSVHPVLAGNDQRPPIQFVAADLENWRLSGELDVSTRAVFVAAFAGAASAGNCVIDVADLDFIDVAAMRVIATCAQASGAAVRLRGASPALRRYWRLGGFDESAPMVQLTA